MALRVLLADESSTIKKVMQLALQEFGVEVKSVPVGLDVVAVSKTFKPDIVFADVLLTKRNGYEVSGDLKNDPETTHIPVVLMWSGFMELDEPKAVASKADRRLEKPFDADMLRNIVRDLVIKTQSNTLSEYLTFPHMPDFDEPAAQINSGLGSEAPVTFDASNLPMIDAEDAELGDIYSVPEDHDTGYHSNHQLEEHDELEMPHGEEFSQVPLTSSTLKPEPAEEGGWSHQDLSKFKIQIPEEDIANAETDDFASKFVIPREELSEARIEVSGNFEEISFDEPKPKAKPTEKPSVSPNATPPKVSLETRIQQAMAPAASQPAPKVREESVKTQSRVDINSDMMEKILREQAREVIESICWKVLPDIAERIVREEIQKILRDSEK